MIGIPSYQAEYVWDAASDMLAAALDHGNGEYELVDIFDAIRAGEMQLWMTPKSVAVTSIIIYPRQRTCLIALAGGDLDDLRVHLPIVEEWALQNGCSGMEVMGRAGWARALSGHGYRQAQVHLRKELSCIPSSEIH